MVRTRMHNVVLKLHETYFFEIFEKKNIYIILDLKHY